MVDFAFKAYRRNFAKEYQTASDREEKRLGILVRLRDAEGRLGFGEIAPIESFGTESFVSALAKCSELGRKFEYDAIRSSLRSFRCLRFAIESAELMMSEGFFPIEVAEPWPVCGLVAETSDLEQIDRLLEEGFRVIKLKIGKTDFAIERKEVDRIVERTEGKVALRLDANGSLSRKAAMDWLAYSAEMPIEHLEQPNPKGEETLMMELSRDYPTAIALDESVGSVDDLKRWRDLHWNGLFVVKPSLTGGYWELMEELQQGDRDRFVFSSSLESKVGATVSLSVALKVRSRQRALGFGVEGLFADHNTGLAIGPHLRSERLPDLGELESLWNQI